MYSNIITFVKRFLDLRMKADKELRDAEVREVAGLRFVLPYRTSATFKVKPDWAGEGLLEALTKAFPYQSAAYFEKAVKAGRLLVDGVHEDEDFMLSGGGGKIYLQNYKT